MMSTWDWFYCKGYAYGRRSKLMSVSMVGRYMQLLRIGLPVTIPLQARIWDAYDQGCQAGIDDKFRVRKLEKDLDS